ncbi:MAG: FG-GAP-like repeat-containing protein [Planctomycetota bacterium]
MMGLLLSLQVALLPAPVSVESRDETSVVIVGPRLVGDDLVLIVAGTPGSTALIELSLSGGVCVGPACVGAVWGSSAATTTTAVGAPSTNAAVGSALDAGSPAWSPAAASRSESCVWEPYVWTQRIPATGRARLRVRLPPDLATSAGLVRVRTFSSGSAPSSSYRMAGPIVLTAPTASFGARFGFAIALGDFNGDTFTDIAIGANGEDVGGIPERGAAYVYWGPGFTAVTELVPSGLTKTAWFGSALVATDIDNDGFDDVVVGAPLADFAGIVPESGAAYVFMGPDLDNPAQLPPLIPEASAHFGGPIAAGDFNGDDYGDVAITSPLADAGSVVDAGIVTVFFGPSFTSYSRIQSPVPAQLAFFGSCLASGPLNGDTQDDLVIGSSSAQAGGVPDAGDAWAMLGPDFATVIHLANPDPESHERYGRSCCVGDFDGNGAADVAMSAYLATVDPFPLAGEVWIHSGPDFSFVQQLVQEVPQPHAQFGVSMAAADLDADELSELAIGIEFLDLAGGVLNAGAVAFYPGGAWEATRLITESPPQGGAIFGFCVALAPRAAVLRAAGSISLAVGAMNADVDGIPDAGRVTLYP